MSISERHEKYISRCLALAAKGLGSTAPNPMVGCIIVYGDRIIGEGYHAIFGGPHAEVRAVKNVSDHSLLRKSTLYVNLEPCSHWGKTPPCTKLIIEKEIPAVIVGTVDPNPVVCGNGIQALKREGINVITDILKEDCIHLNRRFFTFFIKKRPYIILKWAQTKDGFIDVEREEKETGKINWITNDACRRLVHKWRTEEQAILVGSGTVIKDNPRLTVRNWQGKNPLRMVIDREGRVSGNLHILDGSAETIVFTNVPSGNSPGLNYKLLDKEKDVMKDILDFLYSINIQSVIVEGGRILLNEFIKQNLWDEARIFTGNKTFGKGVRAPEINSEPLELNEFAGNILRIYTNKESL